MDEEDVISEPAGNLPLYDASGQSERGGGKPPKNPSSTEAFLIVLVLGVLPDVIDFFSAGAASFASSIISWPITEYYFAQKNLKVPNIRKWIRATNLGDVIPFIGALPLKTIGLLAAIYVAWHPESKISKSVQALEAATSAKEAAKKASAEGGLKIKQGARIPGTKEVAGAPEEQKGAEVNEPKDIYEEIGEGALGVMGPEEQAERETFGEIISTPPETPTEEAPTGGAQKPNSSNLTPKTETARKEQTPLGDEAETKKEARETEELEERLGIGEVEREIKEKLTSPEAVMEEGGIPTFNNGRGVDLRSKTEQ